VHKHLGHIFEKLCVETRTTAALKAMTLLRDGSRRNV
jgi:DNA-binding NarL/FixJ family response regulator